MPIEKLITSINALIDIYADETREYDQPVFVQGGFLQALTGVIGRIRNEVRILLDCPVCAYTIFYRCEE